MRLQTKFKNKYYKHSIAKRKLPLILLKLKQRTKWLKFRTIIKKTFRFRRLLKRLKRKHKKLRKDDKRRLKFLDFSKKKKEVKDSKFIFRIKKSFRMKLQTNRVINSLYQSRVSLKKEEIKSINDLNRIYLIKPLYKINTLLFYLGFFGTTYESNQNINHKMVLVNNKTVQSNHYLKKGDIITINNTNKFYYRNLKKKYLRTHTYLPFLEIDHYTRKVIIIKDMTEVTQEDLSLIVDEYIDLRSLVY